MTDADQQPKTPFLVDVVRDGKFQISYELSDGRSSAFRCDPVFAEWCEMGWRTYKRALMQCVAKRLREEQANAARSSKG